MTAWISQLLISKIIQKKLERITQKRNQILVWLRSIEIIVINLICSVSNHEFPLHSGSAKPSSLRARFENFAKEKEEEDSRRTAEQKRIREEKDRSDREQSLKSQENGTLAAEDSSSTQRKSAIDTGRSGGIGNAINLFNKPDNEPIARVQRVSIHAFEQKQIKVMNLLNLINFYNTSQKEPIQLPKEDQPKKEEVYETKVVKEPAPQVIQQQQPDVIPTQRESVQAPVIETLPPPEQFSGNNENLPEIVQSQQPAKAEEQIYSNIDYGQTQQNNEQSTNGDEQVANSAALVGGEDCDLSQYIEDTKIQAIALYDYQATADDEISFDPNDIITHIEQVRVGMM